MPLPPILRPHRPPLFNSLGVGLFVWLFSLVIAAFAAYALLSVRATERQWRKAEESGALAWSELIQQATHDAMLLNRKKDVHRIIQTVAATPGVVGVRIYDQQGKIVYSADEREVGHRVDRAAEACVSCHQEGNLRSSVPSGERARVLQGADGHRVLGLINPIENSAACSSADCHAHSTDQSILGVLDVQVSMENEDQLLATARRMSLTAATVMALVVGATSALFIQRFVRRPVLALIDGTERIARGDLDTTLEVGSQNEMGHLAKAFNRMTRDLSQARRENEEWSQKLERKVLEETAKVSRTQRQVVHMEKMASLGTLAATVAHELNNPLAGILNYAKLVERSLQEGTVKPEELEEVRRFLHVIELEAGRCGKIVRNFLLFARHSGGEFARRALNPIVDQSLAIIRHHLEMSRVELSWHPASAEAGGDDEVVCDAGQIQQALVDLFVNAVEAMPEGGTLTVAVRALNGQVEVSVADTGVGIPREARRRIFEPFYTTKEGKVGAGLGLSVVYGIVERHGGTIEVESELGHGTTFRLLLPRDAKQPPSKEEPS